MNVDASDQSTDCAPLAALFYAPDGVPSLASIRSALSPALRFSISNAPDESEGWVELLREGLTFDLRGLAGGPPCAFPNIGGSLGIGEAEVRALTPLLLAPGPHLAGAGRLLPVIRGAVGLLVDLARISDAAAISWLPSRSALAPALFERAVQPWLDGGPFPALALTALHREDGGGVRSEGLKFLMGQEFLLEPKPGSTGDHTLRVAVRLVDWLVAHGPVTAPVEAILAGTGAVLLEAPECDRIVARCD